jgi:hypothetical protein
VNKKRDLFYIILFFLIVSLPVLSMAAGIKIKSSENRQLSSMPEWIKDGKWNVNFTGEFDTYFSENFGLRPLYISAYAGLNYYLLGHSVNEQVIPGKNGWLYFDKTVPDYTGETLWTEYEIEKLVRILQIQKDWLAEKGIDFIFMPVPNKNTVYPEYMPKRYGEKKAKNLELLRAAFETSDILYIDLLTLFEKENTTLYQKKDTHWNGYGAVLALEEILKAVNEDNQDDKINQTIRSLADSRQAILSKNEKRDFEEFSLLAYRKIRTGDLGRMLIPAYGMAETSLVIETKGNYKTLSRMRSFEDLTIETESAGFDKKLLMFRDSFASILIPLVSEAFEYCCYSRSIPYDYRITKEKEFDVVVAQIVERNLKDLLENAPIMPARPVQKNPSGLSEVPGQNQDIRIDRQYGLTRISGFLPNLHVSEIYVFVGEDLYPAFPVPANDLQEPYQNREGTGFTMFLDTEASDIDSVQVFYRNRGE